MNHSKKDFRAIQNHLKETGFIFQSSEIYGGLANTYDYGPLGTILLKNIRDFWWDEYITKVPNNFGLNTRVLLNAKVWEASGHINKFADPLVENKATGKRYRADHIIKEHNPTCNVEAMDEISMHRYLTTKVISMDGKPAHWGPIRDFNLMYETFQGVLENDKKKVYLRPEIAQGIFTNFHNVERSMRVKLPFGIGQIGHSFRNEVTPGNYTFRTREFEQMELEYFVAKEAAEGAYKAAVDKAMHFLRQTGIKLESLRQREHTPSELAHYAQATTDIEFYFPFGWGELMGVANRGDFDLQNHARQAGVKLEALNPVTNKRETPHVIEPSFGLDRLALAILIDGYETQQVSGSKRVVMKIKSKLAPYQIAVLPLNKKVHAAIAVKVFERLTHSGLRTTYDESGSIGRRYRRQDAIGTPLCLTVIDATASENRATIRFRDSMEQIEINIADVRNYCDPDLVSPPSINNRKS